MSSTGMMRCIGSAGGAKISRGTIVSVEAVLVQPMTYMNLSGEAVATVLRYHEGTMSDLLVAHDDLDFPPGVVRLKRGGGHGGHNGLRSIISHVGRDFVRVRIGVGKPPLGRGAEHVLSGFNRAERVGMDEAVEMAADAVEAIAIEGLPAAMNRFNRKEDAEDGL